MRPPRKRGSEVRIVPIDNPDKLELAIAAVLREYQGVEEFWGDVIEVPGAKFPYQFIMFLKYFVDEYPDRRVKNRKPSKLKKRGVALRVIPLQDPTKLEASIMGSLRAYNNIEGFWANTFNIPGAKFPDNLIMFIKYFRHIKKDDKNGNRQTNQEPSEQPSEQSTESTDNADQEPISGTSSENN